MDYFYDSVLRREETVSAGEGVVKRELLYVVGGNLNWYNHDGKQYSRGSSKS